jgi:hypothetical protein
LELPKEAPKELVEVWDILMILTRKNALILILKLIGLFVFVKKSQTWKEYNEEMGPCRVISVRTNIVFPCSQYLDPTSRLKRRNRGQNFTNELG